MISSKIVRTLFKYIAAIAVTYFKDRTYESHINREREIEREREREGVNERDILDENHFSLLLKRFYCLPITSSEKHFLTDLVRVCGIHLRLILSKVQIFPF